MIRKLDPDEVELRDVSLRDGVQLLKPFIATKDKKRWASGLHAAGIINAEITSFVPPRIIAQFRDAREVLDHALSIGMDAIVLAPNRRGAELALKAGAKRISFVISASNAHSLANVKKPTDAALSELAEFLEDIHAEGQAGGAGESGARPFISGIISTSFGCSIAGKVDEGEVLAIIERLVGAKIDEISLADTVGYAHPTQVKNLVNAAAKIAPLSMLAAHFHDTRGLGLANLMAALEAGIRRFDASLGGLGGCPFAPGASGNIASEDAVYLLESEGFKTGVDLEKLLEFRGELGRIVAPEPLFGHLASAGRSKIYPQA